MNVSQEPDPNLGIEESPPNAAATHSTTIPDSIDDPFRHLAWGMPSQPRHIKTVRSYSKPTGDGKVCKGDDRQTKQNGQLITVDTNEPNAASSSAHQPPSAPEGPTSTALSATEQRRPVFGEAGSTPRQHVQPAAVMVIDPNAASSVTAAAPSAIKVPTSAMLAGIKSHSPKFGDDDWVPEAPSWAQDLMAASEASAEAKGTKKRSAVPDSPTSEVLPAAKHDANKRSASAVQKRKTHQDNSMLPPRKRKRDDVVEKGIKEEMSDEDEF